MKRPTGMDAQLPPARGLDPVRAAEREVRDATRRLRRRERRERRRFAVRTRRRRQFWLVIAGAVAALAIFVAVGVFTPAMAVREIQLVGAERVDVAAVEEALLRLEGTPLALVDDGEVRAALEPFALIQRYAVERIPPDTLLVRLQERIPVVSIESGEEFLQYDAAGVLVGSADSPPVGAPVAGGAAADIESAAFSAAALVLRDMPAALREQVVAVSASSGQSVTLDLASGVQVVWGGPEETARKAVVLTTMLTALEGTPMQVIDVSSSEAPVFH